MLTPDEQLTIAKVSDLFVQCDKYAKPKFSTFLTPTSQAQIKEQFKNTFGYQVKLFGGFEHAERKIVGVFPEWEQIDNEMFPISLFSFTTGFQANLTHRDYLGAILSLGIERSQIGDILVENKKAFVFVLEPTSDYVKENLTKIGSHGVKIERLSFKDAVIPEPKYEIMDIISASVRLDAIIASILNISRNKSAEMLKQGRIQINHKICEDGADSVLVGDLISIRGFGRLILIQINGTTRKGRLHLSLKKYV